MPCEYSDIIVSPQELKFEVEEGSPLIPPYQNIRLEKASHNLTPRWTAASAQHWIYYNPKSGEAPARIRVNITQQPGMVPGVYQGQLLLGPNEEGVSILPSPTVTIRLEVKAKPVPTPPPGPPVPPPEPAPEPAPEPPPTPPPAEPPAEPPPAPPPPQENWFVRFWKWLLDLFK